jgi:DNA-binding HxlR family transcriptional regulator
MNVNRHRYSWPVSRRTYGQSCTLARTLDLVGERWTLLIVRELFMGPKRFVDLLDGLPGIGRNLLAERLRHLESADLLRKDRLPPPAASQVYLLTDDGRALGPALAELGRFGVERLGPAKPDQFFRPAWGMFPLAYMADTKAARGLNETYEFHIDEETFHIRVDDGTVEGRAGGVDSPNLTVTMDTTTLRALFDRKLTAVEAISGGRVTLEGPSDVLQHALAILAPGAAEPVSS